MVYAKDEMKEMNIVTNKEKKIYFRYSFDPEQVPTLEDAENLIKNGIVTNRATLTGITEELGMFENLKRHRPDLLQAFLGGKTFDPISMGVEAELKKLFAEYKTGNRTGVTCILEIPRECKYVNYIRKLQPLFVQNRNKQFVIPTQFIKAIMIKKGEGYELYAWGKYDTNYHLEDGLIDEKELNRSIHNLNARGVREDILKETMETVKREYVITGDFSVLQERMEIFRKIYDIRTGRQPEEKMQVRPIVEEEKEEPQEVVVYQEKKGFFKSFFRKLKKIFFGDTVTSE